MKCQIKSELVQIIRERGHQERYIHLGGVSKKIAGQRKMLILNELLNGTYHREPLTHLYFSEFVEKFFSEYAVGVRSPATIEAYRYALLPFLGKFNGWRLHQFNRHEIERFLSQLQVSNRTKNIKLSALRAVFNKAVEWSYLTSSPMIGIKRFQESSQGSRALTAQEFATLWEGLTTWQKSVIKVLVYSGMRVGELSNLRWQDIDWENGRLWIVNDQTRKTKNRKSRFIPLHEDLKNELLLLKDYLPGMGGEFTFRYKPRLPHQREYVFCHEDGSPVRSFRKSIECAFKKHGIKGVTAHGLRKTFCSLLARKKVHPKVAQTLMGHSDINLTMKVYTEIEDDQLKEAVQMLPSVHEERRVQLKIIQGG